MPPNGGYILLTDAVGMILPGSELTAGWKHHQRYVRGEKVLEGIADEALRSRDCLGFQEPGMGITMIRR
jgi:hypothetical protein